MSLCHFLADKKIVISWKKCILGRPKNVFWGILLGSSAMLVC